MYKPYLFLILFSLNALAQDYPEHLHMFVEKSRDYFEAYSQKSPNEIEDGIYDESEAVLFSYVDQINGLDIIFSKEEIRKVKFEMVKIVSESFSVEQIEAIIRIAKTSVINKKNSARIFEVALEYKKSKIPDIRINLVLSSKLNSVR